MKKIIFTASVMAIILYSCKKTDSNLVNPSNPIETVDASSAKTVQSSIEALISNIDTDEEDMANNKIMLDLAYGMRNVFVKEPNELQDLVNYAKQSPEKGVHLYRFICAEGLCKQYFNEKLCSLYPEKGDIYDHLEALKLAMHYKGESYWPALLIKNADVADFNNGFYLAIGADVQVNGDDKDYLPAWHIKKNGQVSVELLDEHHATTSKEPVVIISTMQIIGGPGLHTLPGAPIDYDYSTSGSSTPPPPILPPTSHSATSPYHVAQSNFAMNSRFDNTTHSEYAVNFGKTSIPLTPGSHANLGDDQYVKKIKEIHKNSIPGTFQQYYPFDSGSATDYFHFVTFEKDAGTSHKVYTYQGINFFVLSKYKTEIYGIGYNIPFNNPNNNYHTSNGFTQLVNY